MPEEKPESLHSQYHWEHRLHKGVRMTRTDPGSPQQLSVKTVTSYGDVSDALLLLAIPPPQLPLSPYFPLICLPLHISLTSLHPSNHADLAAFAHFHWGFYHMWEPIGKSVQSSLCCRSSQTLTVFSSSTSQGKSHPLSYFLHSSAWAKSVAVPRA